ncbi:MAG: PASTA domain-containing protein [Desulfuromonadales bacterium]|nr:MAG: PASTA domain-containing protein [Desulfuromonadales bacterium]
MGGVFISYRREDSAGHAGRLFDRLREHFGKDRVFMDVSGIEPGVDFVEAIDRAVGSCDVLIVVIGKKWLTCTDAGGRRRLDDPQDFIRLETATALRRDIRVIPVLVQNATMPTEGDLTDDLKRLARRQAIEIGDPHWDSDTDVLIGTLKHLLPAETEAVRPADIKTEHGAPPTTSGKPKSRLGWLIAAATAAVVTLGSLVSLMESTKGVVGRFKALFSGPPAQTEKAQQVPPAEKPVLPEKAPEPEKPVIPEKPVVQEKPPVMDKPPEPEKPPEIPPKPVQVKVPNLAGQSLEKARGILRKAGLGAGETEQRETREAPAGTVVGQAPKPGTKLARGEKVRLVVAIQPAGPRMIPLPDVTGMALEPAVKLLREKGFTSIRDKVVETSRGAPGTVLRISHRPGTTVQADTPIELLVAAEPRGGGDTAPPMVPVPGLTGMKIEAARELIARAGLTVGDIREKAADKPPGTVLAQRPPAGTKVARESSVMLVIQSSAGTGATLPPPALVSPADGVAYNRFPRSMALRWQPVDGAVRYSVEIDCLHCCESGKWCSDLGRPWRVVPNLTETRYAFDFVGAQPGRWRVWAVDKRGREGAKSRWREFRHTR